MCIIIDNIEITAEDKSVFYTFIISLKSNLINLPLR